MKLTKSESTEKNRYELEFLVDKPTFDAAVLSVYRQKGKNMNIPGFRKGKAPKNIIEKMYGTGVFYEDAINDLIPDAYAEAVKEAALDTVGQPEFDVVSIDEDGLKLKAVVYVKPEVKIADYFGIPATKTIVPVSDEEIDREIATVRERNARVTDVNDRPAEKDDTVVIDFDGYVDGKQFDGGKAEKHELKLGSGQFIPGFEDQIIGKNIGDNFDVEVKFPDDYHEKTLAGKNATFKVVLHGIKKTELPALDDEFAKDISEFNTFDEYKADVKAKIQARHDKQADNEVEGQLVDALIEKLDADIPEPMFVAETENFVRDYDNKLRMQGLDLATYFKYTGQNLDSMRAEMRPQAEKQVKTRLALEKIVELEGVTASDDEINAEYESISASYNVPVEEVKKSIDAEAIRKDVAVSNAVKLIKEKAVITEKTPEEIKAEADAAKATENKKAESDAAETSKEKKPAAKKTAAKKTVKKETKESE